MSKQMYYIWSWEHRGWWKPNECGYTQNVEEAGLYTYEQAREICINANYTFISRMTPMPNEAMVPVA